ncbi:MAG: amylo-alpha-1,6-glucosidase [Janthinobacterium lividum]
MTQTNHSSSAEPANPIDVVRADPDASAAFVLKHQDTFVVADACGDIYGQRDGLFNDDTRIVSRFGLSFGDRAPALLSASISRDNVVFTAHLTNHPLPRVGGAPTPEGVLHIERTRFLWQARLYERICCHNYGNAAASMPLSLSFAADFSDMFEVRGSLRKQHGEIRAPQVGRDSVTLVYLGLDDVERRSTLKFSDVPRHIDGAHAEFLVSLAPAASYTLYLEISGADTVAAPSEKRFREACLAARLAMRQHRQDAALANSSNAACDAWLERSRADLALLISEVSTGLYPYAGIPWFSTPFGRDGIITALETLWLEPKLARGVLRYLASRQATQTSSFRDSAPGKIMHETRRGEMAALDEVPFSLYYGGVDSTPLFVVLAGAYAERTGDLALIDELWPALCAAIGWIETVRAASPTGLLDYARGESSGLANQGWKDSEDSVFHADGSFPVGPIALVEVQGYAFRAFLAISGLAQRRGDNVSAQRWAEHAAQIRAQVEEKFWMPASGFYGIALGGDGRLCETLASNAGHLLYTGLVTPERAHGVTAQLLDARFHSGWGVRTLALGQARFNPMSYHNGSVWPHDTALCAAGMRRYGELDGVVSLFDGLLDAAAHFEMRLPELFCGFPRTAGAPPIGYPVACLPQAWSAGAAFLMLQAALGISIDGFAGTVSIDHPRLPSGIPSLSLSQLEVGDRQIDLRFERAKHGVAVYVEAEHARFLRVTGAIVVECAMHDDKYAYVTTRRSA